MKRGNLRKGGGGEAFLKKPYFDSSSFFQYRGQTRIPKKGEKEEFIIQKRSAEREERLYGKAVVV